jgi:hypothetical protein
MALAGFSCWVPPLPQRLKILESGFVALPAWLKSPSTAAAFSRRRADGLAS